MSLKGMEKERKLLINNLRSFSFSVGVLCNLTIAKPAGSGVNECQCGVVINIITGRPTVL